MPSLKGLNEETYAYFSLLFLLCKCAAFYSILRKRKTLLRIVFLLEGVPSCTKTILPAMQATLHNGSRMPALALGSTYCARAVREQK